MQIVGYRNTKLKLFHIIKKVYLKFVVQHGALNEVIL